MPNVVIFLRFGAIFPLAPKPGILQRIPTVRITPYFIPMVILPFVFRFASGG